MKQSIHLSTFAALLIASAVAFAGNGTGPAADPTQAFEVSGIVTAVTGGSGSGMPMLTIDDAALGSVDVALGPIWFLQEAGFSAVVDDQVHLLAYECPTCAAPAVAAWVENITNATYIDLRDEDGRPLWTQRQYQRGGSGRPGSGYGGNGNGEPGGSGNGGGGGGGEPGGSGNGGGGGEPGGSGSGSGSGPGEPGGLGSGLDMTQVQTVTGDVVEFDGHAGSGQPVLSLEVGGEIVEITLSPYQPIAAAGLVLDPGITLEVTFAPTDCVEEPHNVAISIVDAATGVLVQLRDPETGFPIAGGNQQNRPNWP